MTASGISAAGFSTASQQALQTLSPHKHGHHSHSNTDIDAAGSSVASAPNAMGKTGGKVDISA
jgi:hypothetical protein